MKLHNAANQDVTFDSVDLAGINAQVDGALNTAIPGTNVADSINDVLLDVLKPRTSRVINTLNFYSDPQLGLTIPAVAGTLTLPSVVIAGIPTGAVVVRAKCLLISRIIENLNAATNKLDGATVAATSQVVQIKKGAGAWVDCMNFIDDQMSMYGLGREGGPVLVSALDMSATITGNDTYTFQWLLAKADLASLYLQGVHMIIQVSYNLG